VGRISTAKLVAGVAVVSAVATLVVGLVPGLHPAHRNPELHVALVTGEAFIALLAAYLVLGRFRRRRGVDDLILSLAFGALSASNLLFAAIPAIVASDTSVFPAWSAAFGRLLGAGILATAALTPLRRLRPRSRMGAALGAATAALLIAIAGTVALLEPDLPPTVVTGAVPAEGGRPELDAEPVLLATQALGAILFALAAVGFATRATRRQDPLLRWLAVGAVLAAVARLNLFLYPSAFTQYVDIGDVFGLLFYLVVLIAAVSELESYWRRVAAVATLEERRRMARDLHDGLAQELSSVLRNLRGVDEQSRYVERARTSAERAVAEARRAVAALGGDADEPLGRALALAVRQIAEREGTRVMLDVEPGTDAPPRARDALVMIASEAITNAARHGHAALVRVEVSDGRRLRLRIRDDGCGFRVTGSGRDDGHGLVGMRQRAAAIQADLHLHSEPGKGTMVEVVL
jgi:signal transduction histidine kinase